MSISLQPLGDRVRFAGHGSGHGVGMCVIGSAKLAVAGETSTRILARYFPGTVIGSVGPRVTAAPPERPTIGPAPVPSPRAAAAPPPPTRAAAPAPLASAPVDVALALQEGDEGERDVVLAMVRRVVGPSVPVVATYDLHANVSAANVDAHGERAALGRAGRQQSREQGDRQIVDGFVADVLERLQAGRSSGA